MNIGYKVIWPDIPVLAFTSAGKGPSTHVCGERKHAHMLGKERLRKEVALRKWRVHL